MVALSNAVRHDTGFFCVPCSHASSSNGLPVRAASAALMWHAIMHRKSVLRCLATRSSQALVFASGGMKPASSGVAVGVGVAIGVDVGRAVDVNVGVAIGVDVGGAVDVGVSVGVGVDAGGAVDVVSGWQGDPGEGQT